MTAVFTVDTSAADRLLDRLTRPDLQPHERILARQFLAMHAATHVDTESLRGSERVTSHTAAGRWSGEVTAGGPAPGFENDPVEYAVYEAARGGLHDFRIPVEQLAHEHGRAVRANLRGRR